MLGILIPLVLPFVQQAYVAIVGYGFGAVLLRAAVCALILTPPTMLMGATLPVIARMRGVDVGRIYTANLAGGAARHRDRRLLPPARPRRVHRQWRRDRDQSRSRYRRVVVVRTHPGHPLPVAPVAPVAPSAPDGARFRRALFRIHGARRGGGVDPPVVAAVRRQRLHVLADPRDVSRRPRHWRLDRRAHCAADTPSPHSCSAAFSLALALAIGGGRVVDRQRLTGISADTVVSSRDSRVAGADVPVRRRCAAPSPCCRRRSCGERASRSPSPSPVVRMPAARSR